jgi:hypothetical protein
MTTAFGIVAWSAIAAVAGLLCLAVAADGAPTMNSDSAVGGAPSLVVPLGYQPATFAGSYSNLTLNRIIRVQPAQAVRLDVGSTSPGGDQVSGPGSSAPANSGSSSPTSSKSPIVTPAPTSRDSQDGDSTKGKGSDADDGDGQPKKHGGSG